MSSSQVDLKETNTEAKTQQARPRRPPTDSTIEAAEDTQSNQSSILTHLKHQEIERKQPD